MNATPARTADSAAKPADAAPATPSATTAPSADSATATAALVATEAATTATIAPGPRAAPERADHAAVAATTAGDASAVATANATLPEPTLPAWYVGIDVAKAELVVAVRVDGQCGKARAYPNTPAGIRALARRLAGAGNRAVHACMEATGGYGLAAAGALYDAGHAVYMVNPSAIRRYIQSTLRRNKTDPADAAAIAEYAERMRPRRWQPRSPAREQLRQLVHARDGIVAALGDMQRRMQSGSCDQVLRHLRPLCAAHEKQIKAIDAAIAATIANDAALRQQAKLLTTIPGVGPLIAAAAIAEIDFAQFTNARQLCAYLGTCPSRQHSGAGAPYTRLSKQGNTHLRRLLYLGALSAMRHNPRIATCAARWQSGAKGNGRPLTPKQTVCASANKLARQMFGVINSGQPYRPCAA